MADGDYISTQKDVENIFGRSNVAMWANPDNEKDFAAVKERVDWANEFAEAEFLGRIQEGPYDPEEIRTVKPRMAIIICASIAGNHLYDTRRVVDSQDGTDRTSMQKKNVNTWIGQIMKGQLKLFDPLTYEPLNKVAQNSPFVVSGDE